MPRGKTPSLIGSSLGRPDIAQAGRRCKCSRCDSEIVKGDECFDVPQPTKPHSSTRRFCRMCFANVIEQSRKDLEELAKL